MPGLTRWLCVCRRTRWRRSLSALPERQLRRLRQIYLLKNKSIIVRIQAGVEGKVFGSISSKEIALEAKKQLNMDIDKKKIVIPDAIKSLGTYNVNIKLHKDVTGTLAVKVVAK